MMLTAKGTTTGSGGILAQLFVRLGVVESEWQCYQNHNTLDQFTILSDIWAGAGYGSIDILQPSWQLVLLIMRLLK